MWSPEEYVQGRYWSMVIGAALLALWFFPWLFCEFWRQWKDSRRDKGKDGNL